MYGSCQVQPTAQVQGDDQIPSFQHAFHSHHHDRAAKEEMLHPLQVRERNPLPGRMRLLSLPGATQMVSAPNLNTALLSFSSPKHRCIRLATTPIARTR